MTIIGSMVKSSTDIDDEVIVANMLAASAGTANAYLNAALTSPTPELRAIYSSNLTQVLNGHAALTGLAVMQGWERPYSSPTQQLTDAYIHAKDKIEGDEKKNS